MPEAVSLSGLSEALSSAVEKAAPQVVAVHGRDRVAASGFILKPGVVVAAEETIERDDAIEIGLPDGSTVPATLVGRDPSTDIAVLRYDGAAAGEALPRGPAPKTGSLLLAVGRRNGSVVAALGIVSTVGPAWRSSTGGSIDAFIRADLGLTRQAEGGVLLDAAGALVGMAVFGPRHQVIAIPANTIDRVAEEILKRGSIVRGYIGVGVHPVQAGDANGRAAMVVSLDPEGPAKAAGLELGDILTAWNGEPLTGPRSLVDRLGPGTGGTTVELGVSRGGKPTSVRVAIASRDRA